MEFTLLWAALLAVVPMMVVARLERWKGLARPDLGLSDRLTGAAALGVFGGRFVAMLEQGTNPFLNPADVLVVRGGVNTVGASLTALAALAWASRGNLWPDLDLAAPPALAGLAGWHAACLLRGACLGSPTSLPWGTALPGSSVGRHPVELYAASMLAMTAWLAFRWLQRNPASGLVAASALATTAGVRLVTQPLRPSLDDMVAWWYAVAVAFALMVSWMRTRQRPSQRTEGDDQEVDVDITQPQNRHHPSKGTEPDAN